MIAVTTTLRFRTAWLVSGWLFVALVVYLSLTPKPLSVDFGKGIKLDHMSAYAWLMLWFAQLYCTRSSRLAAAAALVAMGIALEYLQGLTDYRDFEYSDMAINAAGVALGLACAALGLDRWLAWVDARLRLPW